ncbi:MAG TPA: alanine dehydrogenase [Chthoniobacteraceae bacterium]|nr:alanine dehydrogenase [Chthoniobacteraceae bacterium]
MKIGIPKEIKEKESRVACTPGGVRMFVSQGHAVVVETGAGDGSGFSDAAYEQGGAVIRKSAAEIFAEAEMILKVKEPQPAEYGLLREGQILFTYLHLAAAPALADALMERGVVAFAYETVQVGPRLPLLEPMSEIAGRMSIIVGSYFLARTQGGKGTLLGGVPGVLPGRVLVLGGGTSGINAGRMAMGLGAEVTILEVDLEKMRFLDIALHSGAHTLYSNEQNLIEEMPQVDLLIGAVLLPGARAPKLIRREMLRQMKPGSVFVDIAIDQGGCAETSRPTSHSQPVFVEEGVTHYCVTNMPSAYARTATQALTNVTTPYALKLANLGWEAACQTLPDLRAGLNICNGKIVQETVAKALSKPVAPPP